MLGQIRTLLESDGFVVHHEDASLEAPVEQLVVPLERDQGDHFALQIMLLPDPDEQFEHAQLVQFYVGVLDEVSEDRLDDIHDLVGSINSEIPIIGFNLHPELFVYFRYVLMVPRGNETSALPAIMECVTLVHYLVETFEPALRDAALDS